MGHQVLLRANRAAPTLCLSTACARPSGVQNTRQSKLGARPAQAWRATIRVGIADSARPSFMHAVQVHMVHGLPYASGRRCKGFFFSI